MNRLINGSTTPCQSEGSNESSIYDSPVRESNQKSEDFVKVAGLCALCGKASVRSCQRCGDFYCSPECQRRDWPSHRYICFPMPPLVRAQASVSGDVSNGASVPMLAAAHPNSQIDTKERNQTHTEQSSEASVSQSTDQQKGATKNPNAKRKQETGVNESILKLGSSVLLTGFRSSNRCFVRPVTAEATDMWFVISKKVDSYGVGAPVMKQMPKLHSLAITKLSGTMHRVEIIGTRHCHHIRVLFIDSGLTATRQLEELREISPEIECLPRVAVMVQLYNVPNYGMNENLMRYLMQYEGRTFRLRYADQRSTYVMLYHWDSQYSLNDDIVKYYNNMNQRVEGCSRPNGQDDCKARTEGAKHSSSEGKEKSPADTKTTSNAAGDGRNIKESVFEALKKKAAPPKQIQKPVMVPPFKTVLFELNSTNIDAIVLDTSCLSYGYIGCVAKDDFSNVLNVQNYLQEYEDNKQPYRPRLEEYCIAKFESDWYRAKVIEITEEGHFTVVYIDFTNENTLTSSDLRRYPADLRMDCRTNLCLIDGLPSTLNEQHVAFLENELKPERKIKIDRVKTIEQQVVLIESTNLIRKMRDANLF